MELVDVDDADVGRRAALPAIPGTRPGDVAAAMFLEGYRSPRTVYAYSHDLKHWFAWLDHFDVDPLYARRFHVDRWVNELMDAGLRPSSVHRMVSSVRNFYAWAVEQDVLQRTPFPAKGKSLHLPKVSSKSQTLGPDRDEARELYSAARSRGERDHAIVSVLLHQGLRASELCALDRDSLGAERGHRTLLVHRKGGEEQRLAIAPPAASAIDTYLATRTDRQQPLFLAGEKAESYPRMIRQQVADVITGCCVLAGFYELDVSSSGREVKR